MSADDDFWLLFVKLWTARTQLGETEVVRRERMLSWLRAMTPQTQAVVRRHIRELTAELGAIEDAMSAPNE